MLRLLEYGTRLEGEWSGVKYTQCLRDAFSLIGYVHPESSKHGALFEKACRVALGELVNGALMEEMGLGGISGLERVVRGVEVCVGVGMEGGDGRGAFLLPFEFE
jgi:hypothetical protein